MSNIFLLFITLYSLLITNLISCVAHLTFHLSPYLMIISSTNKKPVYLLRYVYFIGLICCLYLLQFESCLYAFAASLGT